MFSNRKLLAFPSWLSTKSVLGLLSLAACAFQAGRWKGKLAGCSTGVRQWGSLKAGVFTPRGPLDHFHGRSVGVTRSRKAKRPAISSPSPMSFGALYFAYHVDPVRAAEYVAAVARSAASLKQHDPDIPVAVLTNARLSPESAPGNSTFIDIFLPIRDEEIMVGSNAKRQRQWWTRTLYLNATPFDVTIQIDSDRTICSSIKRVLEFIRGYDMLHVSAGILPAFDNGVMVYRKDARFQVLLDYWLGDMTRRDKLGDDQPSLARALDLADKEIGFKSGVLPPTYQTKMIPAVGQQWRNATALHSLVLSGDVKIVAGGLGLCNVAARHAPQPRVVIQNKIMSIHATVALSQGECDELLSGKCRPKEMHWEGRHEGVIERIEYLARERRAAN